MIHDDQRSLERAYRSAVSGLYARLRSNYDFLYRRFGDEGLKMIAEMSREYGIDVAEKAKARLAKKDLNAVAEFILKIFDTVARGLDVTPTVEQGQDRIIIRVNRCPLNFDNPEMCRAHTTMEQTVVEELNPNLRYRIAKSIPAGDCCCEHIIELKK
jgi:hypothetical protein